MHRASASHVYKDNACLLSGGHCQRHQRWCDASPLQPDVSLAGLPCQPFSNLRQKSGSTPATGDVAAHPQSGELREKFLQYLTAKRPRGFVVENVIGITKELDLGGNTFVKGFAAGASKLGYSVRVMLLSHQTWVTNLRSRAYIVGVGPELGSSQGANWIVSAIQAVEKHRVACGDPTSIWSIVDPQTSDYRARLEVGLQLQTCQSKCGRKVVCTHCIKRVCDLGGGEKERKAAFPPSPHPPPFKGEPRCGPKSDLD